MIYGIIKAYNYLDKDTPKFDNDLRGNTPLSKKQYSKQLYTARKTKAWSNGMDFVKEWALKNIANPQKLTLTERVSMFINKLELSLAAKLLKAKYYIAAKIF